MSGDLKSHKPPPVLDLALAGADTYEMGGRCSNCGQVVILRIQKGHRVPRSFRSGATCPNCGCRRVGAVVPR